METTSSNVRQRRAMRRGRFTSFSYRGRKEHPQKNFVKLICNVLFYCGAGNFWYEDRNLTNIQQYMYNIYATILNIYFFGNVINEYLAKLMCDLTSEENNTLIQFVLGHLFVCCKMIILYMMKKRIKVLLKRFLEEKREFASLNLDEESVKKAKKYCAMLVMLASIASVLTTLDGIRKYFTQGVPIRTEIVLFPNPSHSGLFINILRALVVFHWWYGVTLLISMDCLCTCFLVFTGYKFRTLKTYFEGLGQKYQEDSERNLEVLEGKYIKDFESGILFHKEVLWCTRYVQYALGNLYSVQIAGCLGLIVMSLINAVKVGSNLALLAMNLSFTAGLVCLTGSYMLSAGDISCEAEMIPTAIFHSGWEFTKLSKKIRHLVILTVIASQAPVYMTAFGIFILSYDNFISVLRCSYSFFAVMI